MLRPDQEEDYGLPQVSATRSATLYEHCVRALEHGLQSRRAWPAADGHRRLERRHEPGRRRRQGRERLGRLVPDHDPERVRRAGRAARRRGAGGRGAGSRPSGCGTRSRHNAWDGAWYRRAYFDDGTPLGSAENDECQIDSIAPGLGGDLRCGRPDAGGARRWPRWTDWLVHRDEQLILLFTPPFDQGPLEPGYIKGYVPGIRENGGQYTHAATWVVLATALLGSGDRRWSCSTCSTRSTTPPRRRRSPRYRVEPYVVGRRRLQRTAAHRPRRLDLVHRLGRLAVPRRPGSDPRLSVRGQAFAMEPCIAAAWKHFEITYRHRSATYHIVVENPNGIEHGVRHVTLDGATQTSNAIELADDGKRHEVRVVLG